MQKSLINPAVFDDVLQSASNAGAKGQAQYFTPVPVARLLAAPLPRYRPVIIDLACGSGNLLRGAVRPSTNHLFGCDIDPCPLNTDNSITIRRIIADNARLFSLLKAVDFRADLFVLNPPWDLHVYRAPLAALEKSEVLAVAHAFKAHDGRTSKDTIDSSVATFCMALDRCSIEGEGFIISNNATLQRLILVPDSPHHALASHCWAHIAVDGNICSNSAEPGNSSNTEPFRTGILYFARDHTLGLHPHARDFGGKVRTMEDLEEATRHIYLSRRDWREGREVRSISGSLDTPELWFAVAEEWDRRNTTSLNAKPSGYNLSLAHNGTINASVSLYDTRSSRITQDEAKSLFHLRGKKPMQLVMMRSERQLLERATLDDRSPWTVEPRLREAVRDAVAKYHAVRAPLYPLTPIMRLAYLDEQDQILCERNLGKYFRADRHYKIRSTTVAVRRSGTKINLAGLPDDVEWDGQELAFFITDDRGREQVFMEARLRTEKVRVSILKPDEKPGRQDEDNVEVLQIDFTLQELVQHFNIPDVLDVARINPEGYQRNLETLKLIEELCQ